MPHPGLLPTLFTHPHVWTLLANNSLLSMMKASLALVIRLSLTYPHIPDKARINNHQTSYLVSIRLIFVFPHMDKEETFFSFSLHIAMV